MNVAVNFDWTEHGFVRLEGSRLVFPSVGEEPGIYRFESWPTPQSYRLYIGETDRLRRRFQHYRTPGPTQHTNIRMNAALGSVVSGGGSVRVSTITSASLVIDGSPCSVDLSRKPYRLLVENAALVATISAGYEVENL